MDYAQTAEALERMAVQQQAMAEAAAAFRSLGSIEGATKEANARKDAAVASATVEIERLNKIMQQQADTATQIDEMIDAANEKAEATRMSAKNDADQITSRAQLNALQITNDAKEAADKLIADTEANLNEMRAMAESFKESAASEERRLDKFIADADAAEQRLADARAMLSKLAAG